MAKQTGGTASVMEKAATDCETTASDIRSAANSMFTQISGMSTGLQGEAGMAFTRFRTTAETQLNRVENSLETLAHEVRTTSHDYTSEDEANRTHLDTASASGDGAADQLLGGR